MTPVLTHVPALDVDVPQLQVDIPDEVFAARARELHTRAGTDWVVVWGDREHFGNLHYLTNFDPRFEEALLLLGPSGSAHLVVGNEGLMYAPVARGGAEVVLCQTFSLMGQKRGAAPRLDDVLRDAGMGTGQSVTVVGWKYPEPDEALPGQNFFVPTYLVTALEVATGGGRLVDGTHHLIDPVEGMRAANEPVNIAMLEWGAARASAAMARIVAATRPGRTELEVVAQMGYAGEPLTCHPMYGTGKGAITGLRSPGARVVEEGDAVFSALGYWGGLSCRAGIVADQAPEFVERWAAPYFSAIIAWYETVRPGVSGDELYHAAADRLARGGMEPALNPGHLTATEEWVHTNVQPGNATTLRSGMAMQCDIIPAPLPDGVQINCEDGLVLADAALRADLAAQFPEVWARIEARRRFMTDQLGIAIHESVLPLSNTPGYYAPAFGRPDHVLVNG